MVSNLPISKRMSTDRWNLLWLWFINRTLFIVTIFQRFQCINSNLRRKSRFPYKLKQNTFCLSIYHYTVCLPHNYAMHYYKQSLCKVENTISPKMKRFCFLNMTRLRTYTVAVKLPITFVRTRLYLDNLTYFGKNFNHFMGPSETINTFNTLLPYQIVLLP